jgi:hypothetical protein
VLINITRRGAESTHRVVVPRHGAVLPDPEPVGAVELK